MTVSPIRAAIGLFLLMAGLVAAVLWASQEAPRIRIELPLNGGPDSIVWLCTQPGTLDDATARAKAAHDALDLRGPVLTMPTVNAMLEAMRKAEAEGLPRDEIAARVAIEQDKGMADIDRLLVSIDAKFGCMAQTLEEQ